MRRCPLPAARGRGEGERAAAGLLFQKKSCGRPAGCRLRWIRGQRAALAVRVPCTRAVRGRAVSLRLRGAGSSRRAAAQTRAVALFLRTPGQEAAPARLLLCFVERLPPVSRTPVSTLPAALRKPPDATARRRYPYRDHQRQLVDLYEERNWRTAQV